MSKKVRKRHGFSLFMQRWGIKGASLGLCSLAAVPALKAQSQNPNNSAEGFKTLPSGTVDVAQTSSAAPAADDQLTLPTPVLQAPKPKKNEISASGDFMFGDGQVTLPLGYSLSKSLGGVASTPVGAVSVPRSSTYYGGTLSYSYGQAWYLDFSYAQGSTSGGQTVPTAFPPPGFLGTFDSTFSIDDTWYQVYLKYAFPQLRGKRLSAYLRAGASFISADLKDVGISAQYRQTDKTQDILGNLGFGLGYSLYSTRRLRIGLQFEAEGFYGNRSQDSLETLQSDPGLNFQTANIDNTLYGGIGRATIRLEYRLGQTGLFKIFGEAGIEGRYSSIDYPSAGSFDEYLWGPYAKLGVRYAF